MRLAVVAPSGANGWPAAPPAPGRRPSRLLGFEANEATVRGRIWRAFPWSRHMARIGRAIHSSQELAERPTLATVAAEFERSSIMVVRLRGYPYRSVILCPRSLRRQVMDRSLSEVPPRFGRIFASRLRGLAGSYRTDRLLDGIHIGLSLRYAPEAPYSGHPPTLRTGRFPPECPQSHTTGPCPLSQVKWRMGPIWVR